jgi:hypothetical protein
MNTTPSNLHTIAATQPIAIGRTAEVFAWENGTVLKLYRDWCPPHWATHEIKIAQAVMRAGLPVPAVMGEIIEVDKRLGVIYERLESVSMLETMKRQPWKFLGFAKKLAALHAEIHQLSLPDLPSQRSNLEYIIQHAEHLPDALRARALAALAALPGDTRLCHGDLHPDNILMTRRGPIVIDWMTASSGNPFADVARTSLLLTIGVAAATKSQVPPMLRLLSAVYHNTYLKSYLALNPDTHGQIKRWKPVVAAARLNENIVPERQALLQWVQEGLQ